MGGPMPKKNSRLRIIAEAFGGGNCLAIALGLDKGLISRWDKPASEGGNDGKIPTYLNLSILEAADRCGVPRESITPYLDMRECPCCRQFMDPGIYQRPEFIASMVRIARLWGIEENNVPVHEGPGDNKG